MLFNLKEAGERGENEGTSYRSASSTMSEMDFAAAPSPDVPEGRGKDEGKFTIRAIYTTADTIRQ